MNAGAWWGDHELALDEIGYWRIGPTELWLTRGARDWLCRRRQDPDPLAATLHRDPPPQEPDADDLVIDRLALRKTDGPFRLVPMTADRPVIFNPESRLRVPKDEKIVLYVSTPLWLRIELVDPIREFVEFALHRPSDSWFGPSTMEGELCYAIRTAARLNAEDIEHFPHRVVSAVTIVNRSPGQLVLSQIKLPLQQMSVFATPQGRLWTEKVTLELSEAGSRATLDLGQRPPESVGDVRNLSGPRLRLQRNLLIRAFGGESSESEAT